MSALLVAILVVAAGPRYVGTQRADMTAGSDAVSVQPYLQPIAIYKAALGPFSWPISSKSPEARWTLIEGRAGRVSWKGRRRAVVP